MKDIDLKWYDDIEKLDDFIKRARREGWDIDMWVESDELLTIRIKKSRS